MFSSRRAGRDARRYRRRELTWAPRRTVELYRAGVIGGRRLLEIGGGVGELQIELLRAGIDHAVGVELSGGYESTATRLLEEAGLAGRCERLIGDFAHRPELAEPADLVVLHSVVCCYPDAGGLLRAAADRTRGHLVVSFPRQTWWLRAWAPLQNAYPAVRGCEFRFYVHPREAMLAEPARAGLRLVHSERNWVDDLTVLAAGVR